MIPGDKSYYPGTDILINNFGIRDPEQLRKIEYRLVHVREIQARMEPIEGNFDLDHLRRIHKHLFQDMYAWAGELRTIDFAKRGRTDGLVSQFMPTVVLELKGEELAKFIADRNNLKGLPKKDFVQAITEVHTRLNELHPFREGNGRSARIFLVNLAKAAGYDIDLTKIAKEAWNLASQRAMQQVDPKNPQAAPIAGNQDYMRKIFDAAVRPTLAHAFLNETREAAIKVHPDLEKAYARIDAIARFVSTMPNRDVEKLVGAERDRIAKKLQEGVIPPLNPYLQGRVAAPEVARHLVQQLAVPKNVKAVAKATRAMRA